jgi:hypothetical protein
MSWNGTVTCGWCYREGHNKRTCPDYTKTLQDRVATSTGYAKDHYQEELDKRGRGKAGSHRKCSFCDERGHDRRTCKTMGGIVDAQATLIIDGRKKILNLAKETNFGVGSLIEFQSSGYNKEGDWISGMNRVGTVQNIRWSEITHHNLTSNGGSNGQCIEAKFFDAYEGKEKIAHIRPPFEIIDDGSYDGSPLPEHSYLRMTKIVAPGIGPVTTPDDFFDTKACKKIAKSWMKDKKAWHYNK